MQPPPRSEAGSFWQPATPSLHVLRQVKKRGKKPLFFFVSVTLAQASISYLRRKYFTAKRFHLPL